MSEQVTCPQCNGQGRVRVVSENAVAPPAHDDPADADYKQCGWCLGTTWVLQTAEGVYYHPANLAVLLLD